MIPEQRRVLALLYGVAFCLLDGGVGWWFFNGMSVAFDANTIEAAQGQARGLHVAACGLLILALTAWCHLTWYRQIQQAERLRNEDV